LILTKWSGGPRFQTSDQSGREAALRAATPSHKPGETLGRRLRDIVRDHPVDHVCLRTHTDSSSCVQVRPNRERLRRHFRTTEPVFSPRVAPAPNSNEQALTSRFVCPLFRLGDRRTRQSGRAASSCRASEQPSRVHPGAQARPGRRLSRGAERRSKWRLPEASPVLAEPVDQEGVNIGTGWMLMAQIAG
jgi:hypothetical protein